MGRRREHAGSDKMGELSRHWRRYVALAVLLVLPMLVMISWAYLFEKPSFMGATETNGQPDAFFTSLLNPKNVYDRPIARLSIYVELPWLFIVAIFIAPIVMLPKEEES
jgi:hypothetical protein